MRRSPMLCSRDQSWPTPDRRIALLLLGALLLTAPACSDDGGSVADAATDRSSPVDDFNKDTSSDGRVAEAGTDARFDGPLVADASAEAAPALGCATPAQGTMVGSDVAVCLGSSPVDQCAAASLCATGWAPCTASQYQLRYGASSAPPIAVTESLWLAGCVRDGTAPTAPADGSCSSCAAVQGATETVGWSCVNSVTTTTDSLYVGLRTSSACTHAGTSAPTTKGFWFAWPAKNTLAGALCCD